MFPANFVGGCHLTRGRLVWIPTILEACAKLPQRATDSQKTSANHHLEFLWLIFPKCQSSFSIYFPQIIGTLNFALPPKQIQTPLTIILSFVLPAFFLGFSPPLVGPSTMSQPENLRFPGRCSPATAPWWRDRCAHCARPHWATARAWSIQRRPAIGRPPSLRSVDLKNQGLTTDQQPITIENLWKMWFNITVHLKQRNKVIHYWIMNFKRRLWTVKEKCG